MRDICFLVAPGYQLLDVCGPLQVFATANEELEIAQRPAEYCTRIFALGGGPVPSSSGAALLTEPLPAAPDRPVHTLIIPGGPGMWSTGMPLQAVDDRGRTIQQLVDWTCRWAPAIQRISSVCTGAFLLARTGLLDGGRAVTHWTACDEFASTYPGITVEPDAIYARQDRIWTSAGVTAGIDMALGMIEEDVGRAIAMAVARRLVVFYKRPGGQSQFSSVLLGQSAGDQRIATLHAWIADHLQDELTVTTLAERMAMSPRTFARFYRRATGTTPAVAVEKIRLEKVCRLLESRTDTLKSIATQCGFGSDEVMRQTFLRHLRVSPTEYRERFHPGSRDGAALLCA